MAGTTLPLHGLTAVGVAPSTMVLAVLPHSLVAVTTLQPHGLAADSSSHYPYGLTTKSDAHHHVYAAIHVDASHGHLVNTADYGAILEQVRPFPHFPPCFMFANVHTFNETLGRLQLGFK
ncbi:unnamed protein product [Prunus armeniaca]